MTENEYRAALLIARETAERELSNVVYDEREYPSRHAQLNVTIDALLALRDRIDGGYKPWLEYAQ